MTAFLVSVIIMLLLVFFIDDSRKRTTEAPLSERKDKDVKQ